MKPSKEIIFALATQRGKSGIAVFRISGEGSHKLIKSISSKKKFKTNFATLNNLLDGKNVVDQTLTTFFKSPKSYTGEDMVEISCHGSISVINKITKTLLKKRIRLAEPGEFTKRALMNDKLSVLEAETINDLVNAETENQRKIAIGNLSGSLDKFINEISNKLKKLLADIEAIIDFSDEDLPNETYKNIKEQNKNIYNKIENVLKKSSLSRQIYSGFTITIIGKPNTGKSSFINYINNKDVSIVTNIPGTTTDLVKSTLDIQGDKYTFIDTAGIRKYKNIIEKIGIERSLESAEKSDLNIVFLKNNEKKNYCKIKSKIFVKSKYDTNRKKINGVHSISSVSGYGIENLIKTISNKLKKKPISGPIFSRERHLETLNKSLLLLKSLDLKEIDISAENVRRSIMYIDGINQKFDIEKILDIIFSDFCIGK
ncbi:tRNA uridine-5-carboxymethylaminomethyl(34) synthesis GTPase MnmE [Pelagibacteraceae bacterium]|nr:tRNA uridine-5-carboxymethylaminomethyl(34) synthesis GTPase MnmE [Pelagibacteraceae bacterium]